MSFSLMPKLGIRLPGGHGSSLMANGVAGGKRTSLRQRIAHQQRLWRPVRKYLLAKQKSLTIIFIDTHG